MSNTLTEIQIYILKLDTVQYFFLVKQSFIAACCRWYDSCLFYNLWWSWL